MLGMGEIVRSLRPRGVRLWDDMVFAMPPTGRAVGARFRTGFWLFARRIESRIRGLRVREKLLGGGGGIPRSGTR